MIIIKLIFWKYHDIRILLWYISLIYRTYHWYFRANPAGVWQTDRRTDILLRHSPRYAYASRGKNRSTFAKVMSRLERHVFLTHSVLVSTSQADSCCNCQLAIHRVAYKDASIFNYFLYRCGRESANKPIGWPHSGSRRSKPIHSHPEHRHLSWTHSAGACPIDGWRLTDWSVHARPDIGTSRDLICICLTGWVIGLWTNVLSV